jgi:hypothetical protein
VKLQPHEREAFETYIEAEVRAHLVACPPCARLGTISDIHLCRLAAQRARRMTRQAQAWTGRAS